MRCSYYFQYDEAYWKANSIKRHTIWFFIFCDWCYFSELKEIDKLHLKANKVRILKVFLARFPYMLDKTFTCDRIIQRLIDVDILDAKHKLWPDFYAIKKQREELSPYLKCKWLRIFFPIVQNHVGNEPHIWESLLCSWSYKIRGKWFCIWPYYGIERESWCNKQKY